MNKQCTKCGAANHADAELCSMCGERVGERQKAEGRRQKGWWARRREAVEMRRRAVEAREEEARKKRQERYLQGGAAAGEIEGAGELVLGLGVVLGLIVAIAGVITAVATEHGGPAIAGIGLGVGIGLTGYVMGRMLQGLGGIWGTLERIRRLNVETSKRQNVETGNDKRQTAGPQIAQMTQIRPRQEAAKSADRKM